MLGARKQGDPRVRRLLDQLGYRYTVDAEGNYDLLFELADGRTQRAFINSNTEHFGELEIREVWSVGFVIPEMPTRELANFLLLDNCAVKLGSWRLLQMPDGNVLIIFATQVSADADAETLRSCLHGVLTKADHLEKNLGGGLDIL